MHCIVLHGCFNELATYLTALQIQVQLPERIVIYEVASNDQNEMDYTVKVIDWSLMHTVYL